MTACAAPWAACWSGASTPPRARSRRSSRRLPKDATLAKRIATDVDDRGAACRLVPRGVAALAAQSDRSAKGCGRDQPRRHVEIQQGDRIFAWTQAAMLDAEVFPDPQYLRPDRPPAAYLHFGGGLHPCAGRAVNAFQIPALVGALMRRGIKSVGTMQWAGPFPAHLPLRFER
jgi:hypothetical protein